MIIYLHGFNSSGQSAKGQYLKLYLEDIEVITPTYSWQPIQAIAQLQWVIQDHKDELKLIVGSSLGGFYGQYLATKYQLKLVMINPALDPVSVLTPYIGENENYYTHKHYTFTRQECTSLKQYYVNNPCDNAVPTLLLVDENDEVIDQQYSIRQYQDCAKIIVYPEGDHAFQHMQQAVKEITDFYYE